MAQYLLSIFQPDGDPPPAEMLDVVMRDLEALNAEMKRAGVWVFAAGLSPTHEATVLRDYNGRTTVTDGPFVEAKEHIGGFTLIDVTSRDEAMGWAERLARTIGLPIELRPLADDV